MGYNLQFRTLCEKLRLGRLIGPTVPLTGGHLHRMFSVRTTGGHYAVKALNPLVMLRPRALGDINVSERISRIAACYIPAATALMFDGSSVQEIDGQYYLIFDWVNGVATHCSDITVKHCSLIGSYLATLHKLDFGNICPNNDFASDNPAVNWRTYLDEGIKTGAVWSEHMRINIDRLESWSAQLEASIKRLSCSTVISHRDLEPKNVLWHNGYPTIIDWEAAGRIHPTHDMIETAVYWARGDSGSVDETKFKAFVGAYIEKNKVADTDWEAVLDHGFSSLFGWLEYSLRRSLSIECCDDTERQLGTEHVFVTINAAVDYFNAVPKLLYWLNELYQR